MILGRRERAFVLGSLFHRELDVARLRELAAGGLRWRALVAAAARCGLEPAVASAAEEAAVLGEAPEAVRAALRAALQRNAAQNAALLALLARVCEVLRAVNVVALPIKGAALMLRDPALASLRVVSDVDLLVRRDQVVLATFELMKRGWVRQSRLTEIDVRGRELPQGPERLDSPHGVVLRGETGLLIELHHALPSAQNAPREAGAAFFQRARPVRWGRHEIPCPSLEDCLAVACEHVLVHHRAQLLHHPRLVMDLDSLLALGADPLQAKSLWAPEVGTAIDEGLAMLEEARRGVTAPTRLGRGRAERVLSRAWRWSQGASLRLGIWLGLPAWLVRAVRDHGVRAFFPVRAYMVARYKVAPRSRLVPLLYLWRPIRKVVSLVFRR